MYAVYRVITALVSFGILVNMIQHDFFVARRPIPLPSMLIHFGYLTFFILTVDYCLQVSPAMENLVFRKNLGFYLQGFKGFY